MTLKTIRWRAWATRVHGSPSAYNRFRATGATQVLVDEFLVRQAYKCAICHKDLDMRPGRWGLDHDHLTLRIRGVLCRWCNSNLGWAEKYAAAIAAHLKEA